MREGHIYIDGIISPDKSKPEDKRRKIGLVDIVSQMMANKDAEILKVHINSEGGDVQEGFDIYDALVKSGKQIETIGEGIVASIATIIFLAGNIRTLNKNTEFSIHNPWSSGKGTANDFQQAADGLRAIESKIVDFYIQKTGVDSDLLTNLMNKETTFNAEQAKNYGFATNVNEVFQAVALFNNSNNNQKMDKQEFDQEIDKKFEGFFDKIKNLFGKPKNLKLTAGDGTILDFGEQIQDESEIAIGMTATSEKGTVNGEYVMPSGLKLTFEAGKITVVTPAAGEGEMLKAENEALKKEIEALKAQNLTLKTDAEKVGESVTKMKAEFESFKSQIKTDVEGFKKDAKTDTEKPENRFEKVFAKA